MEDAVKLNEAFHNFTEASKSLEAYYGKLSERVDYLTSELESKNLQLNRAVREVGESRDYLNTILQSIGEAIIVLDHEEKITMINKASEELLCLKAEDIKGQLFGDSGLDIASGRSGSVLTVKDRKYDVICSKSVVTDHKGDVRGYVMLLKDITLLKELERRDERNQRLISMGEMAAKIVHEIRSPLCSIELYATMLSNDLKETEHSEMAEGISTGIKSLNNILTNMLYFARNQKPILNRINLRDTVNETITMLAALIDVRGIKVTAELDDQEVHGDRELLKQVCMNIILNAVQAMHEGGELRVRTETEDDMVTLSVVDEGDGISPENIEKIFDPFFSTKDNGTGLGLAIAHKIVECHNGFITAKRNEKVGSTISISLPVGKGALSETGQEQDNTKMSFDDINSIKETLGLPLMRAI